RFNPPAPSITDIIPGQSIDYSQVGWIRFQHRDPFGAAGDGQGGKAAGNSSRTNQPLLMLQALWQQTSRRLAVINGKVVGEGDSVAGFKVEKIEDDWVWLRGTAGLVRLDFKFNGTVPSKAGENKMNITNRAPESGPPR
ncbi:MAG: general secretion pathway protein GspB, partial [Candidatus Omnitrophica bacterium]|nr:general secretion pathway protein GspB [Candidatus Omnitrophota bacterium]